MTFIQDSLAQFSDKGPLLRLDLGSGLTDAS